MHCTAITKIIFGIFKELNEFKYLLYSPFAFGFVFDVWRPFLRREALQSNPPWRRASLFDLAVSYSIVNGIIDYSTGNKDGGSSQIMSLCKNWHPRKCLFTEHVMWYELSTMLFLTWLYMYSITIYCYVLCPGVYLVWNKWSRWSN